MRAEALSQFQEASRSFWANFGKLPASFICFCKVVLFLFFSVVTYSILFFLCNFLFLSFFFNFSFLVSFQIHELFSIYEIFANF